MQNIKMSWFRYAHDGHPRDKKVGISKNASMFLFTIFYLLRMDLFGTAQG